MPYDTSPSPYACLCRPHASAETFSGTYRPSLTPLSTAAARAPNAHQHLLTILQLLHQPLIELHRIAIAAQSGGLQRASHYLGEPPPRHFVVLVDVRDEVSMRREDEFGVVVEVELCGESDIEKWIVLEMPYLKHIVTKFEHDDMLHP